MSAEWLAIVLPGEADSEEHALTKNGREQVERLYHELWHHITKGPVAILSSSNPDALESASMLAQKFRVIPSHDRDLYRVHAVNMVEVQIAAVPINSRIGLCEAVIVVTHEPFLEALPAYFARGLWGAVPIEYRPNPAKGTGVLLNLIRRNGIWVPE